MTGLIAALCGLALVGGIILVVYGSLRTRVATGGVPKPPSWWKRQTKATQRRLIISAALGILVAITTGYVVALIALPVIAMLAPHVMMQNSKARILKMEALADWTRTLAGVLQAGQGIEQAIIASARSAPSPVRQEVNRLAARLRANMNTETALRLFAEDCQDQAGDLVAGYLLIGSRRRGSALSDVIKATADKVARKVVDEREIEDERSQPRLTTRILTIILTVVVVAVLCTPFASAYRTPAGQLLLALYGCAFLAILFSLHRLTKTRPAPRFMAPEKADLS